MAELSLGSPCKDLTPGVPSNQILSMSSVGFLYLKSSICCRLDTPCWRTWTLEVKVARIPCGLRKTTARTATTPTAPASLGATAPSAAPTARRASPLASVPSALAEPGLMLYGLVSVKTSFWGEGMSSYRVVVRHTHRGLVDFLQHPIPCMRCPLRD